MKTKLACLLVVGAALVCAVGVGSAASDNGGPPPPRRDNGGHGHWYKQSCDDPAPHTAACGAQVVSDANGVPLATASPAAAALGPVEFHAAYNLPTGTPAGQPIQTIAIVDAYDDPNAEADLAVFDTQMGLPACTTANGCFKKVNQSGGSTYPAGNSGWALEIALDVETAHEICENCKILLVEANDASFANLGAAENEAAALGANEISNSWSATEFSGEQGYDGYFNHPGVAITAATGDNGYASGVQYPASSPNVIAVGGTTLNVDPGTGAWTSETVWSGAGSGCSGYESKPGWQTDSSCSKRAIADVSADADPNTGAAVYDTYHQSGWYQVGGTSLATPLIAAVYALADNPINPSVNPASIPYGTPNPYGNPGASLHDITSGNNGTCSVAYLCNAAVGFDGPTGLGTPNGLGAFTSGPAAPTFSLAASPASQTVAQGGGTSYGVTLTSSNGYSGTVGLSVTGLPAGAGGSFSPSSVATAGATASTLSVTTSVSTPPGSYTLTISGNDGTRTRTTSTTLVVQPPPPSLTANPAAVNGGASVTVAWSNISGPNRNNWVGYYVPGTANSAYLGGFYDDNCGQSAGSTALAAGSCSFTVPNSGGTFEFRLFASKATTLLATSNPVTVTVVKATPTLSTTASAGVTLGGSVKDTATLAGGSSPKGTITFSLYGPTDPTCVSTPVTTSTVSVNGNGSYSSANYTPTAVGTYHWIAGYSGDPNNNGAAGGCSDPGESVAVAPAPLVTLTVNTGSARKGSTVTVTWSGVPSPTASDWIALATPGSPNSSYVSRIYDSSCTTQPNGAPRTSGSCSFKLPNGQGTYQFRLFANNTSTLLATSSSIVVHN